MRSKSGNRATTWTRSLVAGLGAVAVATAMMAGPQEAKAQNGVSIFGPESWRIFRLLTSTLALTTEAKPATGFGPAFNLQAFNVAIGLNNGSQNGNSLFGPGINTQIGNVAIGVNNGSQDGNGVFLGINTQIGNVAVGFNNGSQDGNGFLVGINTQIDNEFIGINNGSQDGNALVSASTPRSVTTYRDQQRQPGRQWWRVRHQFPGRQRIHRNQ